MMGLLLSIPLTILRYTYHLVALLLFRRYVFLFVTLPCSVALYRRYQSYLAELAEEERRRSLGMDQNGWVSGGAYVPHRTRVGADVGGEGEVSTAAVTATTNGGLEAMRRRQQERLRQEQASASSNASSGSVLSGASSPAAAAIAGTAARSMAIGRPGATPGVGLRRRKFASPPTSSGRSPLLAITAVAPAASSAKRRRTDNDGNNDDSDGGVGEPLEQLWKRTRQGIDMATTVVSTVLEAGKRKFATAEAEEGREKRRRRTEVAATEAMEEDGAGGAASGTTATAASASKSSKKRTAVNSNASSGDAARATGAGPKGEFESGGSKKKDSKRPRRDGSRRHSGAVRRVSFGEKSPEKRYYDKQASASKSLGKTNGGTAGAGNATAAATVAPAPSVTAPPSTPKASPVEPKLPADTPLSVRVARRKEGIEEKSKNAVALPSSRGGRIALKTTGRPLHRAGANGGGTTTAGGLFFSPTHPTARGKARKMQEDREIGRAHV